MSSEFNKTKFKDYLKKFTEVFETGYNPEKGSQFKVELDAFDKNEITGQWLDFLRTQGPIESVSQTKFEIYDVNNFLDEENSTSGDYIHLVEVSQDDSPSSVFMKFYFVFYCLINGVRSSDYAITYSRRN